jgi:hypothetical protein
MSEELDKFQEKYHPCYKCCVRICCSEKCDPFNKYHEVISSVIQSHFKTLSYPFQLYLGKFYYIDLSDFKVKQKLLMRPTRPVRQLHTKKSMIELFIREIIKVMEK